MIEVIQLPENFVHKSNVNLGGYWAAVEHKDGKQKLLLVDKNKENLIDALNDAQLFNRVEINRFCAAIEGAKYV